MNPKTSHTISDRDLDQLRNSLESIDVFFDSLNRYLPELIRGYELIALRDQQIKTLSLRKLHLLNTISQRSREQIREILRSVYALRRA